MLDKLVGLLSVGLSHSKMVTVKAATGFAVGFVVAVGWLLVLEVVPGSRRCLWELRCSLASTVSNFLKNAYCLPRTDKPLTLDPMFSN